MSTALLRTLAVPAAALVLIVAAAMAPRLLRHADSFTVRRVEVVGAHHLEAADAVAASGITRAANIFDDAAPWREALLRHPLVADARIERRVPATIVLHITEAVPVAFARTPELRAIDEHARILPADPAHDDMDLPVLVMATKVSAEGRAADEPTRRAAAFIALALRSEPGLVGWISEIDVHGDAIRLVLRSATDADVLVPARASAARLAELHVTLADLATPRSAAAPDSTGGAVPVSELTRVRRIDVRFHDQIVVALHGGTI
ncbi:MAG TPA: FtsQ-type POTRA domain-containing protein [Longimicrobiales bacterium]|nr:FtsQ-type POTRA domain-containing protein [Longimicrobiales bacterium]